MKRRFWLARTLVPAWLVAAAFVLHAAQPLDVVVDLDRPAQPIAGFGASTAWYADEIDQLPGDVGDELLAYLFCDDELSLDILRVRIDPTASPGPDTLYDWQDGKLRRQGRVIARVQRDFGVTVMAVPWTAPAWMKDSGQTNDGGRLLVEHYPAYARYLVDWVEGMQREFGVSVDILSVQNEPGVKQWESMEWTTDELATFTRDHLLPELDRRGVDVKLMLNEETNWRPGKMIDGLLEDPTIAEAVDLVGAHAYWGSHKSPRPIASAHRLDKPTWMTEYYLGDYAEKHITDRLHRALAYGQIMQGFFNEAGVNAFLFWWAVSPPNKAVQGLVEIDIESPAESGWSPRKFAAVFGQFSHRVEPGSRLLPVTLDPAPAEDHQLGAGINATAFLTPTRDAVVCVLVNNTDQTHRLRLFVAQGDPLRIARVWVTDATHDLAAVEMPGQGVPRVNVLPRSAMTVLAPLPAAE